MCGSRTVPGRDRDENQPVLQPCKKWFSNHVCRRITDPGRLRVRVHGAIAESGYVWRGETIVRKVCRLSPNRDLFHSASGETFDNVPFHDETDDDERSNRGGCKRRD
jgi:hypothetical protein